MSPDVRHLSDYHFLTLGADTLENPYEFFSRLRREAPVFREPDFGAYLISRYDDVVRVSKSTDTFSAIAAASGPFMPLPAAVDDIVEYRATHPESDKVFTNDPPDHARYRHLVTRLFTPSRIAQLEGRLRNWAQSLVQDLLSAERVEFVSRFSNVFPLLVVSDFLGVPEAEAQRFADHFSAEFANMDQSYIGNPNGLDVPVFEPDTMLIDYFSTEIAKRRKDPSDDILSTLANLTFRDGTEVPAHEIVKICVVLYEAGGQSNTPQLLTNGMQILTENPAIAQELRADLSLVPAFVEETLRFDTSALGLFRAAREDTTLHGVAIGKGEIVMMLYGSANHDEQYFEAPDTFRLDRQDTRVLSFGQGVHTCPGAPLARLEARIAFEELLRHTSDIRSLQAPSSREYLASCILRSPRELPLHLTAATNAIGV
ncbi:cytochrome P450 [Nocardia rhamnosiphila]|uniref:Cytochrome P450 n=1 Tax=Nocardia rhamnosiphila TaxID=426716 RepID=A0ABV2X267_9NOCA